MHDEAMPGHYTKSKLDPMSRVDHRGSCQRYLSKAGSWRGKRGHRWIKLDQAVLPDHLLNSNLDAERPGHTELVEHPDKAHLLS